MAVGTGAGGMLLNLLWGDPTSKVAAAMAPPNPAPNVNPLNQPGASQNPSGGQGAASGGGGAPAAQPAPGQAPAQTYGPDPTNAQNIQTLMEYQQRADSAASLNRHLAGIAAGFGTAQQQHDKLTAMAGLPTSSNALGGLSDIQNIQQKQFEEQQQRIAWAAVNNPQFLNDVSSHTGMTPLEIKTFLQGGGKISDLFGGMIGQGGDPTQQDMRRDRNTWIQQHQVKDAQGNVIPGKYDEPMPSRLVNSEEYKAHVQDTMQKQKDVSATQGNFQSATQSYDKQLSDLNELLDPDNRKYLNAFIGADLGAGADRLVPTLMSDPKAQALYQKFKTLMAGQFAAAVQDFPGSRISTKEIFADAPSKSSMNAQQGVDSWVKSGEQYRQQLLEHRTNLFGKAQQLDHPKLSDAEYDKYLDPIYKEGGSYGPDKGAYRRQPPAPVATPQDAINLPAGRAFTLPDGTKGYAVHSQNDIALLPHGAAFVIPAGPHAGEIDHAP